MELTDEISEMLPKHCASYSGSVDPFHILEELALRRVAIRSCWDLDASPMLRVKLSLWHLRRFHCVFLRRSTSDHVHVGDRCVVYALYDIITALSTASSDSKREAVASTSLRMALSNLYPECNFFREGQMNDASEVLAVIFECLHHSFTSCSVVFDTESLESYCLGDRCVVYALYDIITALSMASSDSKREAVASTSLRMTLSNLYPERNFFREVMFAESSFDELLNLFEMNNQLACDPEAGGCGKLNHIHHILSTPPHVFITVLGWQNTCEGIDDISATLAALATEINNRILYCGLDPKNMHRLVSVVCYYGQHYHCFAYSHDHEQWIMYDDKTVKLNPFIRLLHDLIVHLV
ncbi:hypothetical protein Nepgr_003169 [Nepenthes gracilis]|uniref:Peptidase C19 ubiquitin carboxyl-terminal hydrolase domain-containing protein n=1 Tax=Nepenthes gracilis TaxID=150966 RepID=A0AAD3RZ34_NEPGR|nr:hypothetical protein Nepgr_003169 [Nepenthes gracilis]